MKLAAIRQLRSRLTRSRSHNSASLVRRLVLIDPAALPETPRRPRRKATHP
jgi:hypothetical protein